MKEIKPTTVTIEFTMEEFKFLRGLLGASDQITRGTALRSMFGQNFQQYKDIPSHLTSQIDKILKSYYESL